MPDLANLLGYDAVAEDVARVLSESSDICLIEGPPGVGKSWLAREIGTLWESGGGSTVVTEGDSLRSDVALDPFGFAMNRLPSVWKSAVPVLATAARAGETLIGTAGLITAAIQALANVQRTRHRDPTIFLGDAEQKILYEVERLSRNQPLLLIADNLHWWDARSLDLLGRLRDQRMWSAFPFLVELRVLAVQTTKRYQAVANETAHDALLSPTETRTLRLDRIGSDDFGHVLGALGATPEPSKQTADLVYSLSGGHLALASRCAMQIARGDSDAFLSAASPDEFSHKLLTERIRTLGPSGRRAVTVLQIAALLGLTFRRDEVACAAGLDGKESAQMLRYCRDEAILELVNGQGRFVHELYRQYFLTSNSGDTTSTHEKLSDCLRKLRPGDYALRCVTARDAELTKDAAAFAVQAALQGERDARPCTDMPQALKEAIQDGGLTATMATFTKAREHLNGYHFLDCQSTLDGLPHDIPKRLMAEGDYIRAMCLMSTRSEDDRVRGRVILEGWAGYEKQEPELGIRLMQLLLYGLALLGEREQGWTLEAQIRQSLAERVEFDEAAKDAMYTLDRCCGGLNPPDAALPRYREAVTYFGPTKDQALVRRPVEYYRCLVNLGSSLISNGREEQAHLVYQDLETLAAAYVPDVFPRRDLSRMNGLLAEFRLGLVDAEEAVWRQQQIISLAVESDTFYTENALAVYLALAGHAADAVAIFDDLERRLMRSRKEPEASMTYFIRANRCAARFVARGAASTCVDDWSQLAELVSKIIYPSRPYYIRRHELLANVMGKQERMSANAFDEVLLSEHPNEFGPIWQHYGRGFMLPATEFWKEN